jgi:hypothetical protein
LSAWAKAVREALAIPNDKALFEIWITNSVAGAWGKSEHQRLPEPWNNDASMAAISQTRHKRPKHVERNAGFRAGPSGRQDAVAGHSSRRRLGRSVGASHAPQGHGRPRTTFKSLIKQRF